MNGGSVFGTYFKLGLDHILEPGAIDHILFIITLCISYAIYEWKRILALITAFTIGHCITLALSSVNIISLPLRLVETAIAGTIIVTALLNVLRKPSAAGERKSFKSLWINYGMALFFGMVHGMGFASTFKFLAGTDKILMQLFAFNVGIECAQILMVTAFMLLYFFAVKFLKAPVRELRIFICGIAFGISAFLILKIWEGG